MYRYGYVSPQNRPVTAPAETKLGSRLNFSNVRRQCPRRAGAGRGRRPHPSGSRPPPAAASPRRFSRPRGIQPPRRWAGPVGASPGRGGAPCRPRRAERAEGTRAGLPPCPNRSLSRRRSVAGSRVRAERPPRRPPRPSARRSRRAARAPPKRPGPSPPRPSARPPRPAPAFTLEPPRQPQQGRRRRIEELSRSSRERLLQSRDKMFSKFTSILQHAVEAVRPRAAGSRQAGDGGGLRSLRPRPGPRRPGSRGGARPGRALRGAAGPPGPRAWLGAGPLLAVLPRAGAGPYASAGGWAGVPRQDRRSGPARGSPESWMGTGGREHLAGPQGAPPDSRTVKLLRIKGGQRGAGQKKWPDLAGAWVWLGVVLTLEGGVGRKVCPCWGWGVGATLGGGSPPDPVS